jgi:hypothetical protein
MPPRRRAGRRRGGLVVASLAASALAAAGVAMIALRVDVLLAPRGLSVGPAQVRAAMAAWVDRAATAATPGDQPGLNRLRAASRRPAAG